MIAFRKSNPVLVYGEYNCIDEDHDAIFAYKRFDDQNEFLIVHNMSDQALQWQIQDIADYDLTLSNMDNGVGLNEFQPWQSKIYKRVR
jgi:oligo-1,6-glucosidase